MISQDKKDLSLAKKFVYHTQIKESHLDTFLHVNNAEYIKLMEEARWEMLEAGGYGLEKIQRTQKGPIILGVEIRFKRELRNREKISIETQVCAVSTRTVKLQQKLFREDGVLSAEAVFSFGYFDMKERKLIAPSRDWLAVVGL